LDILAVARNAMLLNLIVTVLIQPKYAFIVQSFVIYYALRNERRIGEAITIASGIGLTVCGQVLGVAYLAYGGLAIVGLGIFSVFWR
jgi:hypothetical protein